MPTFGLKPACWNRLSISMRAHFPDEEGFVRKTLNGNVLAGKRMIACGDNDVRMIAKHHAFEIEVLRPTRRPALPSCARTLSWPARLIAGNAGEDGAVVAAKILEKDAHGFGYNAQTGEYGDLIGQSAIALAIMN
jgi:hypothetical protein